MDELSWTDLNKEEKLLRQAIARVDAIAKSNLRVKPSYHDRQVISHEDLEIGRVYLIRNQVKNELMICLSRPWKNEHGSWVIAMVTYPGIHGEVRHLVDLGLLPDEYSRWTANWMETTDGILTDEEVVKLRAGINWPVATFGPFQVG